jgi:hypothetical protein
MKTLRIVCFGMTFLAIGLALGDIAPRVAPLQKTEGTGVPIAVNRASSRLSFAHLPMSFEQSGGGGSASFVGRGLDCSLFLEASRAILVPKASDSGARETLEIAFQGADPEARIRAEEKLAGVSNYFIGSDRAGWRTGIPHYARVRVSDIYPNIDLVYYGNQEELEFDLIVAPGGDPSRIVMGLKSVEGLTLEPSGDLLAALGGGEIRLRRPVIYQGSREEPRSVDGRFVLLADDRIGFELGAYDQAEPLVVDPSITYATYFGSGGWEFMEEIAVDGAGNLYFTGSTQATNFPTANALYPSYLGSIFDSFVGKINPTGDTLLFSTYFGGNGRDTSGGIAVDVDGDIYIVGVTDSSDFPLVSALQPNFGGNGDVGFGDAYLTKLKSDGSALIYSTYLGGNGDDYSMGVGVDAEKNAYVMGTTDSTNFPTANAFQATNRGNGDMFLSKVNAAGSAFIYSTYLGGSDTDTSLGFGNGGLAVNGSGYAVVVGYSPSLNFPVVNAFQASYQGPSPSYRGDGVVTKFDPTGSVVFSTYLGGSGAEMAKAAAISEGGAVFVTGMTESMDFPLQNACQEAYGGGDSDAFLTAFNSDGTVLYSTYLGGNAYEEGQDIAVNGLGNVYITGGTQSSDFPTVNPIDGTFSGAGDAYVAVFTADGMGLGFSTFLGGTGGANASGIALDPDGNIYVAGGAGAGFPTTAGSYMPNPPVAGKGLFMAKIEGVSFVPGPELISLLPSSASAGDPGFSLSVVGNDFVDGAVVRWSGSNRPTTFVSSSEVDATIPASDLAAGKTVQVTVRNPDTGVSNALPFTINNPAPTLSSIDPTKVSGGGAGFTLTVTGTSFVPNSIVLWNGSPRTTTYVNATELQGAITAADAATPGEVQVTVSNPAPAGGTSTAAVFSVSGYAISATPTSATVTAGQSATYTIQLTPQFGSFDSVVTFSCAGLPSKCTATFSSASTTPGSGAATTILTLATKSASGSGTGTAFASTGFAPSAAGGLLLILALLAACCLAGPMRRRAALRWIAAGTLVCLSVFIAGCGGGGGGGNNQSAYTGTQKGSHQITVQGVSGGLTATATVTLIVN